MRVQTKKQRGVSLIATVFIIVILAFMGVMFVSLINTGSLTSVNDMQSLQALSITEGGLEYVLGSRIFPNYSMAGSSQALGAGNFSVATPAYLTGAVNIGDTTINVNSTAGFASPSGRIVIDSEIIPYTGTTANSFTSAGPATGIHTNGNAVYPVTRVANVSLANNCTTTDVQVDYVNNFLIPGIITIGNEYLYCTGTAAGPTRFTGCTRCYQGSFSAAHSIGDNIFQYVLTSAGVVGSAQRVVQVSVGRGAGTGIAFDAASSATSTQSSISWPHTVSGSSCFLLVGISISNTTNVTSVTYNGTPLTFVGAQNNTVRVEIWRLVNPTGGSHTVVVTLPAAASVVAGAVSFTGVDQINPLDGAPGYVFATSNNPSASVAITTVTNNAWVAAFLASNNAATVGGGQTERWNTVNGTTTGAASTNGPINPAGATTMTWSIGGAPRRSAIGAVALKPASASGGVSRISWQEAVK